MAMKSVAVASARCMHSRSHFGIRIELQAPKTWVVDWAFPLKETSGHKEGYDRTRVEGNFTIGDAYPGCPFCSARSLIQCECGHVSCISDMTTLARCPWCGNQGRVSGQAHALDMARDR
jgi:hypothetical protein